MKKQAKIKLFLYGLLIIGIWGSIAYIAVRDAEYPFHIERVNEYDDDWDAFLIGIAWTVSIIVLGFPLLGCVLVEIKKKYTSFALVLKKVGVADVATERLFFVYLVFIISVLLVYISIGEWSVAPKKNIPDNINVDYKGEFSDKDFEPVE